LLAVALLFPLVAPAQKPATDDQIEAMLVRWNFQLDLFDAELKKNTHDGALLNTLRNQTEALRAETAGVREQAAAKLKGVKQLLDALGPAPAKGQPPEEASVTQQRRELRAQFARFEGRLKKSELANARSSQILQDISRKLRDIRAQELLARGPSPLSWHILISAGPHLLYVLRQLVEAPLEEWAPLAAGKALPSSPRWPLLALVAAFILLWPARRWLLGRFVRDRCEEQPSFARKTVTAIMVGIARGVLPAMISGAPLLVLTNMNQQQGIAADMLVAALLGITFVLLVSGLARAALAPFSVTGWRMTPLTHNSSRRLYRRIVALSWVAAGFVFIELPAHRHLQIPPELSIFYDFIADTIIALFILSLLPARLWRDRARSPSPGDAAAAEPSIRYGTIVRIAVGIIAVTIPVASLLGYANLSNYLTDNLFLTGIVIGLSLILHGLARDLTTLILERRLGSDQADDDPSSGIFHFWLVAAFDLVLALIAGLVLLTAWGVAWKDLKIWLLSLSEGIKIGSFTFSFTDLLSAILLFVVVLAATRALQRLLEFRIFPKTRLDIGVRNSLKAATGYTGLVIAIMLAISTIGLDLSNLAIIAGALSVGIGFGLQNVVNNFVSGLILLIERPIKVGDWIVIGNHEGYVKRINVRATEIETFQRASVIIPNSELLSSALVNWTHKDTFARVEVPVGVAYGSDTARVKEILLDCARQHATINPWPQPYVRFQDFGESALDFELRFFISQADEAYQVASDLRFAIDNAFREQGVEIPFPQRDIHVRGAPQPVDGESGDQHPLPS